MQQLLKQLLLVSWLLTHIDCLFAQSTIPDVLYRLNRTPQNVRVKNVTSLSVLYTESNSPTTIRRINKTELWKVVYGNGRSIVYNEPVVRQPVSQSASVVTSPPAQPIVSPIPETPAANPVATTPRETPAKRSQSADLKIFQAGRQALSFGPDLTLGSRQATINTAVTTSIGTMATNNIGLKVFYQKFKTSNVSIGGGLTVGLTHTKTTNTSSTFPQYDSEKIDNTPFITLMGLTRRYLPVTNNIAFYGFGSAELNMTWYKTKSLNSAVETLGTQQRLLLNAGAGLTYLFTPRFSIDFDASLLNLTINRVKDSSPGSKASVDLSLTGYGSVPSFSLFLTIYF